MIGRCGAKQSAVLFANWYHGMRIIKQHANAYCFSIVRFNPLDFAVSDPFSFIIYFWSPRSRTWMVEGYLQLLRKSRVPFKYRLLITGFVSILTSDMYNMTVIKNFFLDTHIMI